MDSTPAPKPKSAFLRRCFGLGRVVKILSPGTTQPKTTLSTMKPSFRGFSKRCFRLGRAVKIPSPGATQPKTTLSDSSGIALFMVMSAVSVLAILVTEFTYIAQISQSIAYGGLDQAKAHYLAKSGLKLSLLRLKAYQQVKKILGDLGSKTGGPLPVPKSMIEKIWNFPFFYPLPTNIPGMSGTDKAMIEKFQKESSLEGKYSALIESESSKYNLNLLLAGYFPNPNASPQPNASPTPTPLPNGPPSPPPVFDAAQARDGLYQFITSLIDRRVQADPDQATAFRDYKLDEIVNGIAGWSDRTYQGSVPYGRDIVPMKRAPFYSLSELHMLPNLDDELFNVIAPNLSVNPSASFNINTLKDTVLAALIPAMTKDELTEFFKFRDSEEVDNQFKKEEDFYAYLMKSVQAFRNNQQEVDNLKASFAKRGIRLVTDEVQFKITINAQVNHAARTIEAWVTLNSGTGTGPAPSPTPIPVAGTPTGQNQTLTPGAPPPDPGLRITFMRML